jgi:hypothetical protein
MMRAVNDGQVGGRVCFGWASAMQDSSCAVEPARFTFIWGGGRNSHCPKTAASSPPGPQPAALPALQPAALAVAGRHRLAGADGGRRRSAVSTELVQRRAEANNRVKESSVASCVAPMQLICKPLLHSHKPNGRWLMQSDVDETGFDKRMGSPTPFLYTTLLPSAAYVLGGFVGWSGCRGCVFSCKKCCCTNLQGTAPAAAAINQLPPTKPSNSTSNQLQPNPPGVLLCVFLIDRVGRRCLLVSCSLGLATIAALLAALMMHLTPRGRLTRLALFALFYAIHVRGREGGGVLAGSGCVMAGLWMSVCI